VSIRARSDFSLVWIYVYIFLCIIYVGEVYICEWIIMD
jgi:hypothetical protein